MMQLSTPTTWLEVYVIFQLLNSCSGINLAHMKHVLLSLNFMEHIMVSFYHIRTKVSVAQIFIVSKRKVFANDFKTTSI